MMKSEIDQSSSKSSTSLIVKFIGPTWDPPGAERTQVGPYWRHTNLAIWDMIGCDEIRWDVVR